MCSSREITRRFRHSSEETAVAALPLRLPIGFGEETAAVALPLRLPIGFGEETEAAALPLRLPSEFACLPIER